MQESTDVAIGFQIQELRVTSYSINEEHLEKGDQIGFGIQLQHLFNSDTDSQIVRVELEVGRNPEAVMIVLHLECQYKLTSYRDWLSSQSENNREPGTLPFGLATTLNSISISTARGVLFERLRGTALQRIVLPIIDPSTVQLES